MMILPVGSKSVPRGAALWRRDFPGAEEAIDSKACRPRSATKAASRPISLATAAALDLLVEAIGNAGYAAGQDVLLALDLRGLRVLQRRKIQPRVRGQALSSAEFAGYLEEPGLALPDRVDRGRHGGERLGTAGSSSPQARQAQCSSSGDDLFVTNTRILREGIEQGSPTRS
jgi:enolase